MPFNTSAMPWAFIVLLLATSSMCSGHSARSMLVAVSDATAATAATATAATASAAAATTAATATAAALTTADTAAAAATLTAASATVAATTTAAAAAAAAAAGSGRKLLQTDAPAAALTAAAAATAATSTAATAASVAATTAATAALIAATTAANAAASATLTAATATAAAVTTAAADSANGADRRLQQDAGDYNSDVILPPTSGTAKSPPTVELGEAEAFTVLSSATVTNTGPTDIGGYIGVAAGSSVTGEDTMTYTYSDTTAFPNGGRANITYATEAKLDVTTANNDAASRTDNVVNINQVDVGGLTFTPGLYKTTTALEVASGDLTLSGEGNSSGVFIFQIKTTFEVRAGLKIVLTNQAQACNVFSQLGSAGLFEVDSVMAGTVLGESKVVLQTGAKIEGRLFSNNAAVTLDSNEVDFPDEDTVVVPGSGVINP
eukprot:gene10633-biopygen8198